jgi:hypothetical protein
MICSVVKFFFGIISPVFLLYSELQHGSIIGGQVIKAVFDDLEQGR